MSYDTWKTTPPDTDICTEDAEECPCPECAAWRDNREPRDSDREDWTAGEARAYEAEQMVRARRLK